MKRIPTVDYLTTGTSRSAEAGQVRQTLTKLYALAVSLGLVFAGILAVLFFG